MRVPAPNFTQTPNVFFDEIMKNLNEGELRVILLIMRQTFGWHKLEDWITLQLIAEKTGYERRSICRILERLIQKNLVSKRIIGLPGQQKCYYSLVTEIEEKESRDSSDGIETQEEMDVFKKSHTSDRPVTPPSDRRVTRPVTDGSPTKETITKEKTTTKENAVVVFDCLKNLDEPDEDKQSLMKYPEEKLIQGIRYMKSLKTQPDNPIGYLHWYCESDKNLEPIEDSTPQQKFAKKFNEELKSLGFNQLHIDNEHAIPRDFMFIFGKYGEPIKISLKNDIEELKKDFDLCRKGIQYSKIKNKAPNLTKV